MRALNLLIGHIVVTSPYVIRTVVTSLLLVDYNLEDAARTLGASRLQTFWRITLPQIAPGVAAGALFAFMVSFDNYPVTMWLANSRIQPGAAGADAPDSSTSSTRRFRPCRR